ncbi:calcium-binding protein [Aestuariivirga sp.]|uniref:calcium-binding protein n=1 Tax=Aestuariivirga sp. TaxID=2650926 RepID=UPI0035944BAE
MAIQQSIVTIHTATELAEAIVGGTITKVSYLASTAGVNASLLKGTGTGGYAEGDTYSGILNLQGSTLDDYLTGDALNNQLQGGDGRDRLNGGAGDDILQGGAGNDSFVGGAGADVNSGGSGARDVMDFSRSKAGVELSLDTGGWAGDAEGDVYLDIEYVYGTGFADVIGGNDSINRLIGNAGNDVIDGAGGNDYILGGAGGDLMMGGSGDDVFVIEAGFGNDIISDFEAGAGRTDRVWLQGTGMADFGDVLANAFEVAGTTVISIGVHGTLTLENVGISQLAADDFIFG